MEKTKPDFIELEILTVHVSGSEVNETDDNSLSIESFNSPWSRLSTTPAAECFRVLPSSNEVDYVLWTVRHRHRAVARLSRHCQDIFMIPSSS